MQIAVIKKNKKRTHNLFFVAKKFLCIKNQLAINKKIKIQKKKLTTKVFNVKI